MAISRRAERFPSRWQRCVLLLKHLAIMQATHLQVPTPTLLSTSLGQDCGTLADLWAVRALPPDCTGRCSSRGRPHPQSMRQHGSEGRDVMGCFADGTTRSSGCRAARGSGQRTVQSDSDSMVVQSRWAPLRSLGVIRNPMSS
jgi:hypothetical protein